MEQPIGRAGSWFAHWQGENVPCIHAHAIKGFSYVDAGVDDHAAWPAFIEGLRDQRKAIVTTSHPSQEGNPRRRKGYVAMFEVSNVEVIGNTLTLNIGKLLVRFN